MSTQTESWQKLLACAITDPAELLKILELDPNLLAPARQAAHDFSLRIPRGFVNRMQKGNPHDPLLLQVLPLGAELQLTPGFYTDPLAEQAANPIPGLLHKYHGRVLLIMTGSCAINCRYCFRRHFPYSDNNPGSTGWEAALDYIRQDSTIKEVILSGGDPLLAKDAQLAALTQKIADIPHVQTLRIHSRIPVVLPERITDGCVEWLTATRLRCVLVLHINHPQEIDSSVEYAINRLRNITLLNQSVLLKNINDSSKTLIDLSERLFDIGILPYYLHLLDPVQGTAHFNVEKALACQLITEMANHLPGYLVPRLVQEKAGELSKLAVLV